MIANTDPIAGSRSADRFLARPLNCVPDLAVSSLSRRAGGAIGAALPGIHTNGPLGKPSWEEDEREAALKKDSFLFCVVLVACLNCMGQPVLMILSHWQHWQLGQLVSVVASALILNITLFGCLPTLYASWKVRQLLKE